MTQPNNNAHWANSVSTDSWPISRFGLLTVGLFLLLFSAWSVTAKLASAVVAEGAVIPVGKNKVVQHASGGIVREINAIDGQLVKAGDTLLVLDPVIDQAQLNRLRGQRASLMAQEARLSAHISGQSQIPFPDELALAITPVQGEGGGKRFAQIIDDQIVEFDATRRAMKNETSEVQRQIESTRAQISSLQNQRRNLRAERASLKRQLERLAPLVTQGYYSRINADDIERQVLRLNADLDALRTDMTRIQSQGDELEDRLGATIATQRATLSRELSETRAELESVTYQLTAADSAVSRLVVKAPADGILAKSTTHTIGGVIGPREVVAEIIPGDGYIVEAKVAPQDIDFVKNGQQARVVVTAFNQKTNEPIPAVVKYVSADSEMDDDRSPALPFYTVRLAMLNSTEVQTQIRRLRAGMQGQVYITTGERTFLQYLTAPLSDGLLRAFNEN